MARQMKDSGIEWIGEIPETWDVAKVGYFFDIQLGKMLQPTQQAPDDVLGKYLCAANVGGNQLKYSPLKEMWFSPSEVQSLKVQKGDMLVVEGGDVASCDIVNEDVGELYFQNALHRVRPTSDFDIRILKYWLWMTKGIGHIDLICNKATIAHFSKEKFIALPVVALPLGEQQRIAAFLDRKCAEIDAVIERTKATIEEYKKLKQAVITEAVTKGVRGPRPMKDSGIEWIGEIPVSFEKFRVKHVTDVHGRIGFRGYTTDDMVDAGEGAITLSPSNIRDMSMNYDKCSYISWEKYSESPEIQIHDGDLLMVKTGSSYGKTALVANLPMEATINPQLIVMNNFRVIPQFLNYYFHTYVVLSQIENAVVGGTIPTMAQEKINNFYFFAPALEEQQEIAAYLNEKCAALDTLIAKKTALLTELETYKKSLIHEYVTGKKEVL